MDEDDYVRLESLALYVLGRALRAHRVPADGHCQFHALLAALRAAARRGGTGLDVDELDALDAYTLRERLVDWLRDNGDTVFNAKGEMLGFNLIVSILIFSRISECGFSIFFPFCMPLLR